MFRSTVILQRQLWWNLVKKRLEELVLILLLHLWLFYCWLLLEDLPRLRDGILAWNIWHITKFWELSHLLYFVVLVLLIFDIFHHFYFPHEFRWLRIVTRNGLATRPIDFLTRWWIFAYVLEILMHHPIYNLLAVPKMYRSCSIGFTQLTTGTF